MSFAAMRMDLEIIILSKVRQSKTNITSYHLCVESKKKKMIQMNLFTKPKQTHRLNLRLSVKKGRAEE